MTISVPSAPEPHGPGDLYASTSVETVIDIAPDNFFAWYLFEPIENFMLGTLIVPPITATEALPGPAWGEAGSIRKITFKDGTTSLERILSTDLPRSYRYQPWAYTNPVRVLSDYAVSSMRVEPIGGKCRVVWDYSFHARYRFAKPLLQLFVTLDWRRNLANGLKIVKQHLETAGPASRIR